MTDEELIARLRDPAVFGTQTAVEAADRIEALLRDAKAHEKEIVVWSENYAALERNLAKAVGALQNIAHGGAYTDMQVALAALAKIGGGA